MHVITKRDWALECTEAAIRCHRTHTIAYRGLQKRTHAYGQLQGVPEARLYVKKIDRAEWPERIRDRVARRLFERTRPVLPNHDQDGHSSCWVQAPIRATEIAQYLEGEPPRLLSPESVLIPIDGDNDEGGNPEEAILRLMSHGACRQELWPANDFNPRHAAKNWLNDAAHNKIARWVDLRDYDDQISFALHDLPHVVALKWMRHAMCALDPELIGKTEVGLRLDNSWGIWGDRGTKVYDEESATGGDWGAWGILDSNRDPL